MNKEEAPDRANRGFFMRQSFGGDRGERQRWVPNLWPKREIANPGSQTWAPMPRLFGVE
jgi:hypothetical protein